VAKEYEIHANKDCPFRRPNKVQKWQLKAPSQRGCQNLPLDEDVLYMTMALFDYTMSPELIRSWFKKLRPFFKCEDKAKLEFERSVKEIQEKVMQRDGIQIEEEEGGSTAGRIMPFEFLYLLCNARPRMVIMQTLQAPKPNVKKIKLGEFYENEDRR